MSLNYAERLSKYKNKGICGLPEVVDSDDDIKIKCSRMADMLLESKHTVIHTGAGISTAAGIPDFRGPQGVWTREKRREKVEGGVAFEVAQPTLTHQIITEMVEVGVVRFVVSQNVDGLHLRSGLPRECLSELHGNVMMERCERCGR
jgi:mono-ADP-ribosyltransferase sirtuin 6